MTVGKITQLTETKNSTPAPNSELSELLAKIDKMIIRYEKYYENEMPWNERIANIYLKTSIDLKELKRG